MIFLFSYVKISDYLRLIYTTSFLSTPLVYLVNFFSSVEDFGAWITILFSSQNPAIILDDIIILVGNLLNMLASQFPVLYSNDLHIQIILLLLFVNCTDSRWSRS